MKLHFIAIGGSVMHNLAITLRNKGYKVTGSDDEIFEPAKSNLQKANILPDKMGWHVDNITTDLDAVILGMHAKDNNPELLKAIELGIKIYSFPQYIYDQTIHKKRVVIGGSHGKTTITSMIMHVLSNEGINFDYMVGAKLEGFETMVKLSDQSSIAVLEGDEYLSSAIEKTPKFHFYKPHIALISGIAWDHINVFPTFELYLKQFETFIHLIEKEGMLIYNEEDPIVMEMVKKEGSDIQLLPYSTPDYSIRDNSTYLQYDQEEFQFQFFGKHNLLNMEGARAVCNQLGVSDRTFYNRMQSFKGAAKRLEVVTENESTAIFRDFAHAPSKLKASVNALKDQYPQRTLIVCMELHTYSSLNKDFLKQYQNAMSEADIGIIYYNPETLKLKKLERIAPEDIIKGFKSGNINVFTSIEEMKEYLFTMDYLNTNFALMSSGNFGEMDFSELISFAMNN